MFRRAPIPQAHHVFPSLWQGGGGRGGDFFRSPSHQPASSGSLGTPVGRDAADSTRFGRPSVTLSMTSPASRRLRPISLSLSSQVSIASIGIDLLNHSIASS